MLWVSLKWNCALCGNAFLLRSFIISIFSVMGRGMSSQKNIYRRRITISFSCLIIRYVGCIDIDPEQVNGRVRGSVIVSPMSTRKSSFSSSFFLKCVYLCWSSYSLHDKSIKLHNINWVNYCEETFILQYCIKTTRLQCLHDNYNAAYHSHVMLQACVFIRPVPLCCTLNCFLVFLT